MGRNEKKYGTIGLMILTVIIIFSVVGIVIAGFRMIKKNEDARLISAADTEYNKDKEKRQEIEDHLESDGTQEANTETETKGESEEHSICLIRQRLSILYRIFLYLIPMD